MNTLTHVDQAGQAHIVDVSGKARVRREAVARGHIRLQPATMALIRDNKMKKGDVLACARIAGIMAAKNTPSLIPLCHAVALDRVVVGCVLVDDGVEIVATAVCVDRTGVEMEALTAVAVAALTIYDMAKAVDTTMRIGDIVLVKKEKGAA